MLWVWRLNQSFANPLTLFCLLSWFSCLLPLFPVLQVSTFTLNVDLETFQVVSFNVFSKQWNKLLHQILDLKKYTKTKVTDTFWISICKNHSVALFRSDQCCLLIFTSLSLWLFTLSSILSTTCIDWYKDHLLMKRLDLFKKSWAFTKCLSVM